MKIPWFQNRPTQTYEDVVSKVIEALERCGLASFECAVQAHQVSSNRHAVLVKVKRDDPTIWRFGPHIETYIQERLARRYNIDLSCVRLTRCESAAFNDVPKFIGAEMIFERLKKERLHWDKLLRLNDFLSKDKKGVALRAILGADRGEVDSISPRSPLQRWGSNGSPKAVVVGPTPPAKKLLEEPQTGARESVVPPIDEQGMQQANPSAGFIEV